MPTYIDGICASQNIDSSGEIVDIAGLDISSLDKDGTLNWEHLNNLPMQVVGKILKAKKIFNKEDCENDRHLYFYNKCKTPYVYILGELFDDYVDSAKHVAGLFRYDDDHRKQNERDTLGFSVEGAKLPGAKEGMTITRSIARKCTITLLPCNKVAVAELVPKKEKSVKNTIDELFKTEPLYGVEFFAPVATSAELLQKKEEKMEKDVGTGGGAFIGSQLAMKEDMAKSLPKWTSKRSDSGDAVHYSHPEHGTVSIVKTPKNKFHVKHQGKLAGLGGVSGEFDTAENAGKHAGKYMASIGKKKILPPTPQNPSSSVLSNKSEDLEKSTTGIHGGSSSISGHEKGVHLPIAHPDYKGKSVMGSHVREPSPGYSKEMARIHSKVTHKEMKDIKPDLPKSEEMNKALEAGSSMGAPSTLVQGAALAKESIGPKKVQMTTGEFIDEHSKLVETLKNPTPKKLKEEIEEQGGELKEAKKLKKSKWLARAEEEYGLWEKREQFENFMQKRLPHLTKGEIKAIGQTLVLRKAMKAEAKLSKMFASYFGKDEKGREKGVHSVANPDSPGKSLAGRFQRDARMGEGKTFATAAKEQHEKVLGEIKDIKPNLPKSEDLEKAKVGEGPHKHHQVSVAENADWHLKNLWETPSSPGSYRTIKEMSPQAHREHHKLAPEKDKQKLTKTTDIMMASENERQETKPLVFRGQNEVGNIKPLSAPVQNVRHKKAPSQRARVEMSNRHVKPSDSAGKTQTEHLQSEHVVGGHPAGKFRAGDRVEAHPSNVSKRVKK